MDCSYTNYYHGVPNLEGYTLLYAHYIQTPGEESVMQFQWAKWSYNHSCLKLYPNLWGFLDVLSGLLAYF